MTDEIRAAREALERHKATRPHVGAIMPADWIARKDRLETELHMAEATQMNKWRDPVTGQEVNPIPWKGTALQRNMGAPPPPQKQPSPNPSHRPRGDNPSPDALRHRARRDALKGKK